MEIIISNSSPMPIYEQITSQIKEDIILGRLKPGDNLPSMRALAKSLHISVITVQRAYEDLRNDGFIETVVGHGTFVSQQNKDLLKEEKLKEIEEYLEKAANLGSLYGIELERLVSLLTLFYNGDDI